MSSLQSNSFPPSLLRFSLVMFPHAVSARESYRWQIHQHASGEAEAAPRGVRFRWDRSSPVANDCSHINLRRKEFTWTVVCLLFVIHISTSLSSYISFSALFSLRPYLDKPGRCGQSTRRHHTRNHTKCLSLEILKLFWWWPLWLCMDSLGSILEWPSPM